MIFITLGSQKFQFNRLLKKIDLLIADKIITDEVFAQTGYSDYEPQHYEWIKFLNREEFSEYISRCNIVITHGGTGAIIGALKKNKKVIAVPRLAKYGEHVDDHQIQLLRQFDEMNLICACYDLEKITEYINRIVEINFNEYISNTSSIIDSIEGFLLN